MSGANRNCSFYDHQTPVRLARIRHFRQVVGHILIRNSHMNIETLHAELGKTHVHRRMICVPVDVPSSYVRYLRSAASRSFGPNEEEKSGVDFTMRTIGRRFERKPKEDEDEVDGDEEDDEGAEDHEDLGVEDAVEEDMLMEAADPHMMTAR